MEYEIAWKDSTNAIRKIAMPFRSMAVFAVAHIRRAGGRLLRIKQNGDRLPPVEKRQMVSDANRV
ncbi:MAG: hypothetical protein JWN25_1845 [Verrucomicrobiales bacterium]|jgi:hypothetical protein|nr:hypothetical protein [Verrucomicrobiales bacterium]